MIITTVSLSWRFGMRVLQKANTTEAHRWRVRVAACGLQPVARDVDLKSGEVLTIATEDADQTADIVEVVPLLISSWSRWWSRRSRWGWPTSGSACW